MVHVECTVDVKDVDTDLAIPGVRCVPHRWSEPEGGWVPMSHGYTNNDGRWDFSAGGDAILDGMDWKFTFDKNGYYTSEIIITLPENLAQYYVVEMEQFAGIVPVPVPEPEEIEEPGIPRPTTFLPNWTWKDYALVIGSLGAYLLFKDELRGGKK